jgi:hypothetical protein
MKTQEFPEILRHSVIGGIVAVCLVWFHQKLEGSLTWKQAVLLGFVFVAAFTVLAGFERIWINRQERKPFYFRDAGTIDGFWLSALWDSETRALVGCAITEIRSSGRRFTVGGPSYNPQCENPGNFRGEGFQWDDSSFIYHYRGHEGIAAGDFGVGYYAFTRAPGEKNATAFNGAYVARGLGRTRYVLAEKISEADLEALTHSKGLTLLRKYLARMPNPM